MIGIFCVLMHRDKEIISESNYCFSIKISMRVYHCHMMQDLSYRYERNHRTNRCKSINLRFQVPCSIYSGESEPQSVMEVGHGIFYSKLTCDI
jgi:hypothetical protein